MDSTESGEKGCLQVHGKRWDAEREEGEELRGVNMFKIHCMKFSENSFFNFNI